jgi:hypothetical protein
LRIASWTSTSKTILERTTSEIHEECLRLCRELKSCLDEEWTCLVAYRPEGLLLTNQRKEGLIAALAAKKAELRLAQAQRNESLTDDARTEWSSAWELMRDRCEENQRFMRHSLRNMECLLDNIKHLMGRSSLYSSKGKRVDMVSEGKVVTAKY